MELLYLADKKSNEMHFYQAQADIVVEQLIYGAWGSTGVECMALGKPVVCYVREEWWKNFTESFPEHDTRPYVQATPSSIYEVLKRLVTDTEYRNEMGRASREFAERQYDPVRNSAELARVLDSL